MMVGARRALAVLVAVATMAGCSKVPYTRVVHGSMPRQVSPAEVHPTPNSGVVEAGPSDTPDGTPAALGSAAVDIYDHTRAGQFSPAVEGFPSRVYVPNDASSTIDVIDPATFSVVSSFPVGKQPQHVTPAWDLSTLYVDNDKGNSLTPIDPRTGLPGPPIPVDDPYNLYFTPDGSRAVVVAEARRRLDFRDPHSWAVIKSLPVPCLGVDHADFSPDGTTMFVSCEFSGQLLRIDVAAMTVVDTLELGGIPQDVKLSPDGRVLYVANGTDGLETVDPVAFRHTGHLATGRMAHGLYVSRDSSSLYVSNRGEGSVSVVDLATSTVRTTWTIGGSPDMGGVSADGTQLWLTGRYHGEVYVIDTDTGQLLHTIKVGKGPHGLCVFPQPGRYSLGHTGVFR